MKFSEDPTYRNRAVQIWLILIGSAARRETLTYGMLVRRMGLHGVMPPLHRQLGHVMYYCQAEDLPPLTVLAVNKTTGRPGKGLDLAINQFDQARERVFRFPWYELVPPTPDEFNAAYKTEGDSIEALEYDE